jgi:homoserine kinase
MNSLHLRVPASAANLGPGFDTLALALDLHNELTVEVTDGELEIQVEGEGEGRLPTDASNMIVRAAYRFFRALEIHPPGLRIRSTNGIPLGSGLGSSAAAIVSGLMTADAISETGMSREQLLEIAWEMEGHADNAAAAIFGGLTIVGQSSDGLISSQITLPPMQFVIVVPEVDLPTSSMRDVLPRNVPLNDAALNLGRMGLVVEALRQDDFDLLSRAVVDRLHEPYRAPLIPGFFEARSAGLEAGAAAVALAGAGPSLIAFAANKHQAIADAMADAFSSYDLPVRTFTLAAEPEGARLLRSAS